MKLIAPMVSAPDAGIQLPAEGWYPYNINKTMNFWLTYLECTFVGSASISIHIGADTLLTGLMIQTCVQLRLLKHRLCNLSTNINSKIETNSLMNLDKDRLLKHYIVDHQFIYRCNLLTGLN